MLLDAAALVGHLVPAGSAYAFLAEHRDDVFADELFADRGYHPGRVAVDLAVMLADGSKAIADLAVLRNQSELFGLMASDATAWRVLDGIDDDALARIRAARFATGKNGIPTQSLQRTLEIGSYQTMWAMLHRIRSVLVRPGRDRLTGTVEVDVTYIGGEEPGQCRGRAGGRKVLTVIAVEVRPPRGIGRCRMAPVGDGSADSLHGFVTDNVEPGTRVITDGWQGYHGLDKLGYVHERHSQRAARARGQNPSDLLPTVHRLPR